MQHTPQRYWRFYLPIIVLLLILLGLLGRLIDLGIISRPFLLAQSAARIIRTIEIPANRGMIKDRNGAPLAISTPVESVWINPQLFEANADQLKQLSHYLQLPISVIKTRAVKKDHHEFVYLKRAITPELAFEIKRLDIVGLYFQEEYKRFYPEAEVSAHVVGFTNIDDRGQEGLELAYNRWLQGVPGKKRVLKDRLGHIIDDLEIIRNAKQGNDLPLSLDQRIQYVAYRDLKAAVEQYHAQAGSVVVLDAQTGEVLAMVNQPSYNPNARQNVPVNSYRNRAATDQFEPGSIIKPFTIALALQSGQYTPESTLDTAPGWMRVGGFEIRDDGHVHGIMNLTEILQKSSNIGAAKIMLSLKPHDYWVLMHNFGFGEPTQSGFPGEARGSLEDRPKWYASEIAASAYGYGLSVTALQLAQAYSVFAENGVERPVTFLKLAKAPEGRQIISPKIAHQVLTMMQAVVAPGGTGTRARVPGYLVAGKTGTAYIAGPKGYDKHHRYVSSFVGIVPVSQPRFVVAVVIYDPQGQHFGAIVSAPVFAKVSGDALRLMDIRPDDLEHAQDTVAAPFVN